MIDLQKFCSTTTDSRDYLRQPTQHSGWLIATNGHICVRVPDPTATQPSPLKHCAATAKMFEESHKLMRPLPDFAPGVACSICNGAGHFKQVMCNSCDGEGVFDHCDHDYDCKACDGDGWLRDDEEGQQRDCQACHGRGVVSRKTLIYGTGFEVGHLRLIQALPGVMIAVVEPAPDPLPAMYFTFDGGEGLLMPMRG